MTELLRPVRRETRQPLDGSFCRDRGRVLVVMLEPGDVLTLWPKGTRAKESIRLADVYRYAASCRANRAQLERARQRKAKKAARLAAARIARAERQLFAQNGPQ